MAQTHLELPVPGTPPATPPFPYSGGAWNWPPSLHIYEYGTGFSPNIGLHLRDQQSGLLGTSQWGVAFNPLMYSAIATPKDVVLNANEAEDLIIANLSGSKYSSEQTDIGAIRFATAPASGVPVYTAPLDVERMTILNNGNVGVNQKLPTAKFQVTQGSVILPRFPGHLGVWVCV